MQDEVNALAPWNRFFNSPEEVNLILVVIQAHAGMTLAIVAYPDQAFRLISVG